MTTDTRPYNHNRPIWFLNMLSIFNWHLFEDTTESYLDLLLYWAPSINIFLDGTMVKNNNKAQAVVDVCYRLFLRYADFLRLSLTENDSESIRKIQATFKRLDGLTILPKPKREKVK